MATSSSSPSPFIVGYLMDHLGYSKDKVLVAFKSLLRIPTLNKLDVVLTFLCHGAGLSTPQLCAFVYRRPTVLAFDVCSNLLPKLKILKHLLPSPDPTKDLAFLATTFASNFSYSTAHFTPAVDHLRSLLPPPRPAGPSCYRHRPSLLLLAPHHQP